MSTLTSRRIAASFKMLNAMISRLVKKGSLTLIDAEGVEHVHGSSDGEGPRSVVRLHDPALYSKLFLNPELIAGEAFMDGTLTCEDGTAIADLLQIFHTNAQNLRGRPFRRTMSGAVKKMRRFQQHNPVIKARENVAHHYDLSNDFYKMFLDEGMNYSCAYYENEDMSLEEAQYAKLRHIASKMRVGSGMRILDIGCGWGGMAFYLAEHLDARVIGVTLSKEQQALALARAEEKGLKDKVEIRLMDYREVREEFDRIVSIGMFEHVGVPHYTEFFDKVFDLLKPDGLAVIHAIGHRTPPNTTGPWIRKYIFPGGYSPSLSETFAAIERSGLWVADTEILRLHYAYTLREWRRRFEERRGEVAEMFDEKFCRMWEFYLSTSEFAFRNGGHFNFQLQLTKSVDALPIRRDYMREAETALLRAGS